MNKFNEKVEEILNEGSKRLGELVRKLNPNNGKAWNIMREKILIDYDKNYKGNDKKWKDGLWDMLKKEGYGDWSDSPLMRQLVDVYVDDLVLKK